MKRSDLNPIITPKDVKPSYEGLKVEGVFNAGVTRYKDEVILLLRVAESAIAENEIKIPVIDEKTFELKFVTLNEEEANSMYDCSDSRMIAEKDIVPKKIVYLTSLSHIRLARSKDGVNFTIDEKPFIRLDDKHETWGAEDPRVSKIDDTYYINYTAVSRYGAATALVTTKDFVSYERQGVIFPAENKDVSIIPEKINGKYYVYHRPVPQAIGCPDIWISESLDLKHFGNHKHLLGVSDEKGSWENGRIGGGAPSFKTEKGWIHIYHAADKDNRYCLGAFLADLEDPSKIIAKTKKPILEPADKYEVEGFFGNVVFTCGALYENDKVSIYYGAADECMALVEFEIEEIYDALGIAGK